MSWHILSACAVVSILILSLSETGGSDFPSTSRSSLESIAHEPDSSHPIIVPTNDIPSIVSDSLSDDRKPNIVMIVCDDLNSMIEGLGGHPQAKTPNIKRLMESGTTFREAHCNIPLCKLICLIDVSRRYLPLYEFIIPILLASCIMFIFCCCSVLSLCNYLR